MKVHLFLLRSQVETYYCIIAALSEVWNYFSNTKRSRSNALLNFCKKVLGKRVSVEWIYAVPCICGMNLRRPLYLCMNLRRPLYLWDEFTPSLVSMGWIYAVPYPYVKLYFRTWLFITLYNPFYSPLFIEPFHAFGLFLCPLVELS